MNIPKQSSPVMRSISTVRLPSKNAGVMAQATPEEINACMARCSDAPNSTSRQMCRDLCQDL